MKVSDYMSFEPLHEKTYQLGSNSVGQKRLLGPWGRSKVPNTVDADRALRIRRRICVLGIRYSIIGSRRDGSHVTTTVMSLKWVNKKRINENCERNKKWKIATTIFITH